MSHKILRAHNFIHHYYKIFYIPTERERERERDFFFFAYVLRYISLEFGLVIGMMVSHLMPEKITRPKWTNTIFNGNIW